jgi:hypothetical protein
MTGKKLIIEKRQDSSTRYQTTTTDADESYDYDSDYDYTDTTDQTGEGRRKFVSIMDSHYKKPPSGSKQDNLSREDIKKKLKGYIPLMTMSDKKMLTNMPYFKTWVRYISNKTKQFRTGGLLTYVAYPDYIMLVNTAKNITWSVQLKDNTIYVPDSSTVQNRDDERQKKRDVKEKLYDMYKRGQLKKV